MDGLTVPSGSPTATLHHCHSPIADFAPGVVVTAGPRLPPRLLDLPAEFGGPIRRSSAYNLVVVARRAGVRNPTGRVTVGRDGGLAHSPRPTRSCGVPPPPLSPARPRPWGRGPPPAAAPARRGLRWGAARGT